MGRQRWACHLGKVSDSCCSCFPSLDVAPPACLLLLASASPSAYTTAEDWKKGSDCAESAHGSQPASAPSSEPETSMENHDEGEDVAVEEDVYMWPFAELLLREMREDAAMTNADRALQAAATASNSSSEIAAVFQAARQQCNCPNARSSANALLRIIALRNACPYGARDFVLAAERAVRELVANRCYRDSGDRYRDSAAFIAALEDAFGGILDLQLHSQMLQAYMNICRTRAEPAAASG